MIEYFWHGCLKSFEQIKKFSESCMTIWFFFVGIDLYLIWLAVVKYGLPRCTKRILICESPKPHLIYKHFGSSM